MTTSVYTAISKLAEALQFPVTVLTLVALAAVVFELGVLGSEWWQRRTRPSVDGAFTAVPADFRMSRSTLQAATTIAEADSDVSLAKALADFDFRSQRRLLRTRILIRFGPALGLMGTLIPLTPALQGLAHGDVAALGNNLKLAFSVTVLGLLIGSAAYAITAVRENMYDEDHSDLECFAAVRSAVGAPS